MRKIFIVVAVVIIACVAVFYSVRGKNEETKFKTEPVTRGEVSAVVSASGTVNAVTTVLVGTQVSGIVRQIYADFNSPVKMGRIIAEIDPSTFEAQVEQARANLQAAKANVEKAEAGLLDAKRSLERNRELLARNFIAKGDADTAETNHASAAAQLNASRAQVSQTEAALKTAETNLGYTKIISPVDGIVISRNIDVGQTVAASFQTPTLFSIAKDLTKMQINASVDEADIGRVREGHDVEFRVDAYPDRVFKGTVSQVRNAPVTVQNVVTYDVVIKVDNPELMLKPGMTANVSIVTSRKVDVLKVPNSALRFKPDKEMPGGVGGVGGALKGSAVYALDGATGPSLKAGKPRRIPVETGISDGSYTELVSGDLREGQELIVESLRKNEGNTNTQSRGGPRFF